MRTLTFMLAAALLGAVIPAAAYVGPGLGAGTLGVILGFIGSVFLALFAIVWFPVKRMLKRRSAEKSESVAERRPQSEDDKPAQE